jgi:hypothetical protein
MELRECQFSERWLNCFEVHLSEPGVYAFFPVAVSEESMEVRVIVECLAGCPHSEDSG